MLCLLIIDDRELVVHVPFIRVKFWLVLLATPAAAFAAAAFAAAVVLLLVAAAAFLPNVVRL